LAAKLPPYIHPQWYPKFLYDEYPNLGPAIYLDTWPISPPTLFINHPTLANQATLMPSLPKHSIYKSVIYPVAGKYNLLTLEGNVWKKWRSIFNPGFAASHLLSLVPGIVELSLIFCDTMSRYADAGVIFSLEHEAAKLAFDIIGKVTLWVEYTLWMRHSLFIL
jgi:cytochrome P450